MKRLIAKRKARREREFWRKIARRTLGSHYRWDHDDQHLMKLMRGILEAIERTPLGSDLTMPPDSPYEFSLSRVRDDVVIMEVTNRASVTL